MKVSASHSASIREDFLPCFAIISTSLKKKENIVISSTHGRSRAPSIVLFFLTKSIKVKLPLDRSYGCRLKRATNLLLSKRSDIRPKLNMINNLKKYFSVERYDYYCRSKKGSVSKKSHSDEEKILGRVGFISVDALSEMVESQILGEDDLDTIFNRSYENSELGILTCVLTDTFKHKKKKGIFGRIITNQHLFYGRKSEPRKTFEEPFEMKPRHDDSLSLLGSEEDDHTSLIKQLWNIRYKERDPFESKVVDPTLDLVRLFSYADNVVDNYTNCFCGEIPDDNEIAFYFFDFPTHRGPQDYHWREDLIIKSIVRRIKRVVLSEKCQKVCWEHGVKENQCSFLFKNHRELFEDSFAIMDSVFHNIFAINPFLVEKTPYERGDAVILDFPLPPEELDYFKNIPNVIFPKWNKHLPENLVVYLISNNNLSFDGLSRSLETSCCWSRSGYAHFLNEFSRPIIELLRSGQRKDDLEKFLSEEIRIDDYLLPLKDLSRSVEKCIEYLISFLINSSSSEDDDSIFNFDFMWKHYFQNNRKQQQQEENEEDEEETEGEEISKTEKLKTKFQKLKKQMLSLFRDLVKSSQDLVKFGEEFEKSIIEEISYSVLLDKWYNFVFCRNDFFCILWMKLSVLMNNRSKKKKSEEWMKVCEEFVDVTKKLMDWFTFNEFEDRKTFGIEREPKKIMKEFAIQVKGLREWSRGTDDKNTDSIRNRFIRLLGERFGHNKRSVQPRPIIIARGSEKSRERNGFGVLFGITTGGDSGSFLVAKSESEYLNSKHSEDLVKLEEVFPMKNQKVRKMIDSCVVNSSKMKVMSKKSGEVVLFGINSGADYVLFSTVLCIVTVIMTISYWCPYCC